MPRPVHFEIYADDLDRACAFYERLFGWDIKKWDGPFDYRIVTTGTDPEPGINGAITSRPDPAATGRQYVTVPSVDEYLEKAVAAGGAVLMPKTPIPGIGYSGVCRDTEGNTFGLFQDDPTAS